MEARLWSCRESNPGPNKEASWFLHAYLLLIFENGLVKRTRTNPYPLNLAEG